MFNRCYKDIIVILKSGLTAFPEEINYLFELERYGCPNFLRRLVSCFNDEDIKTMTDLMEALRIPLMAKIEINVIVFLIIIERKMASHALRYYMNIMYDNDCRLSAIGFLEACVSYKFLIRETLDAIDSNDFEELVCIALECEFEVKRSLITIISKYIEFHRFDAVEAAVQIGILKAIKSFISDHIQLVLDSLNAIIGKYYEEKRGDVIYSFIEENKIIKKLNEA
ncbi:hypothetical protein TVAG_079700 [Trichomonas vaginalis G3]|uniref:Uncharacterized protein n=1 Tax=Trichomonas vaginalis (strain ATCC PRA-98 / G3) TaxID=412133 RepID=A2EFA0_TRIV3|nr:hypothetical protein TVAGG3_1030590 [Trichomonas vaginalis G3]EAY08710.1 hypothetical protein TVAG_079700 [Trichomonas vaginalis G3]KAI5492837.1 hypothetical protein TVAGG3_1030590 [Trichomonas vaginalis G3]|eukprot:XP_001320933.1 hypothetical protein [Trichomonas vaginalis G3]